MKNILLAISVVFAISACEKKQDNSVNNYGKTVALSTEQDLAKDAKKVPLTTVALSEFNYDFGNIEKGKIVEHDYEIVNTGKNPLVISAVRPGCGCTVPEFTHDPILPGKTGKITLKFNSVNFEGMIHKFAEIFANTEKTPIQITFTGNVVNKK